MKNLFLIAILLIGIVVKSHTYPSYGQEIVVTINGLSFDAMEPFVSPDGSTLFFNNLNSGGNTKLFYATKINDSTFNYVGELNGTNQLIPPYLDGVADLDSLDNFYWTSTRNYGAELETLFHGNYSNGNVTNIGRVHGDFNKNIPGWLVMDHGVSNSGDYLAFINARFATNQCQGGPCETEMGMALKVNDSTFNKVINSASLMQNVNDTNFIYYAPCLSSDELELYYTRYARDSVTLNTSFEICVAIRNTSTAAFSVPMVLFSETFADLIEAPTLTFDKQIIYYHRKIIGSHKIVMRYRDNTVGLNSVVNSQSSLIIYPNPASDILKIKMPREYINESIQIYNSLGYLVKRVKLSQSNTIDVKGLPNGIYFLRLDNQSQYYGKFIKE